MGFVYLALLVAVVAYVLARGDPEERLVVSALLLGSLVTLVLHHQLGKSFTHSNVLYLMNEASVLAVILFVAYRSSRFWPLPVAAFQVAAFLALLTPALGKDLISQAIGVAQGLWAYPQLAIVGMAVVRRRNRQRKRLSTPSPV